MSEFAHRLLRWHQRHGRHDLPWQLDRDPYRIWLSEIMLQQTQVGTVIPYYLRFLERFPTLYDLAKAEVSEVMGQWSGLGYYARARNLHLCARTVWHEWGGEFPHDPETLAGLPGIGRSTANAIAAFCFSARTPILDGNVKRVLARVFGIEGFPGSTAVERSMWALAESLLPPCTLENYIQAQMDFGATQCTRSKPLCDRCPLENMCVARRDGRVVNLPTPRPKKTLPLRQVTVLILRNESRILLLQRPSSGIWGGLLSLPELETSSTPSHTAELLGCHAEEFHELPNLLHAFTHFKLNIQPLMAEVNLRPHVQEERLNWIDLAEMKHAPLPAPIRRIIQHLSSTEQPFAQQEALDQCQALNAVLKLQ